MVIYFFKITFCFLLLNACGLRWFQWCILRLELVSDHWLLLSFQIILQIFIKNFDVKNATLEIKSRASWVNRCLFVIAFLAAVTAIGLSVSVLMKFSAIEMV